MIRLLFPEISFTGLLGRGAFWREFILAVITAPIVIGVLSHIVIIFSVATANGLAIDVMYGPALAALLVSAVVVRNAVAFCGIVKRRMNDIGYNALQFWLDSWMVMLAVPVAVVMMMADLPLQGKYLLAIFLFYLAVSQLSRVVRLWWRLLFEPGHMAHAPQRGRPTQERAGSAQHDAGTLVAGRPADAERDRGAALSTAGLARLPVASHLEALRRWLDQPVLATDGALAAPGRPAARTATPQQAAASPSVIKKQVVAHHRNESKAERPNKAYQSPSGVPIRASYGQPRQGRSTFWSGLLRGPWG